MRVTYLVLAHNQPQQFARLLRTLADHPETRFVVHIDRKADEAPFRRAAETLGDRVTFVAERQDIRWGSFAVVRAELDALDTAVRSMPADYYFLLSGADYPIRRPAELDKELDSGAVYLYSRPMPTPPEAGELGKMYRLERFYWATKQRNSVLGRAVNKALRKWPKRNVARGLGGREPFAGSQWWGLPHDVAQAVLEVAATDRRLMLLFRFSRHPDEMFFQTIVHALPHGRQIRPGLTYTDWSRPTDPPGSPITLTAADIPAMRASGKFFARKFAADPAVLDAIDEQLLGQEIRVARMDESA